MNAVGGGRAGFGIVSRGRVNRMVLVFLFWLLRRVVERRDGMTATARRGNFQFEVFSVTRSLSSSAAAGRGVDARRVNPSSATELFRVISPFEASVLKCA